MKTILAIVGILLLLAASVIAFGLADWVAGLAPLDRPVAEAVQVAYERASNALSPLAIVAVSQLVLLGAFAWVLSLMQNPPRRPFDPGLPGWKRKVYEWANPN